MRADDSSSIGEYPSGKLFHVRLRTRWCDVPRSLDAAFDVGSMLKRRTEHFLLIGAVGTPERPVHFGALRSQTRGKCVQSPIMFVLQKPQQTSDNRKHYHDKPNFGPGPILPGPVSFLLPFSAFL